MLQLISVVFLPTAYVVRREGYVLTRVCPSVRPHLGGGYPGQVQAGRGVSQPGPAGGYPCQGSTPPWVPPVRPGQGKGTPMGSTLLGVPNLGYPPVRPGWGYPTSGTPLVRPDCGVPLLGGNPSPPPQSDLAGGGIPHFR